MASYTPPYTTSTLLAEIQKTVKLFGFNPDAAEADRLGDRIAEARGYIISVFSWWYTKNAASPNPPTDGVTAALDAAWYQLALSFVLLDAGQIERSKSHFDLFIAAAKFFREVNER